MSHLKITEAVPLGYALVARVAHDAGVRALCIKGPLTSELGLRPETHVSQDVDVLVHPAEAETLALALERVGWRRAIVQSNGYTKPHSMQLQHAGLGIEVDVHHRFPGFIKPPAEVFEHLWSRRRGWDVAGVTCPASDSDTALLIELLHLGRLPSRRRPRLRRVLASERLHSSELHELMHAVGADTAVAPLLGQIAPPPADAEEMRDWQRRQLAGLEVGVARLHGLVEASWRRRPLLLARALWAPRDVVYSQHPELRGRPAGLVRAQSRRWLRAARALPGAARRVREARAQARSSAVRP